MFFNFTASDYSGWLIVAVTVERWLAVARPLSAPRFCSRTRAFKVSQLLLLALVSVNIHFLWTVRIIDFRMKGGVVSSCYYEETVAVAWPWVDAFLYSFVPSVVIITLNGLIIRQVIRAKRERVKLRAEGIRSVPQSPSVTDRWRLRARSNGTSISAPSTPLTSSHISSILTSASVTPSIGPVMTEESGKITAMLLIISFSFLFCTLPINVMLIVSKLLPNVISSEDPLLRAVTFRLVRTPLELLMYVNHAINFYLYVASGTRFRSHVLWMLRSMYQRRRSTERSSGQKGADSSQFIWPTAMPQIGCAESTQQIMKPLKSSRSEIAANVSSIKTTHSYISTTNKVHSHHHSHQSQQDPQRLMVLFPAQSRRCSL